MELRLMKRHFWNGKEKEMNLENKKKRKKWRKKKNYMKKVN